MTPRLGCARFFALLPGLLATGLAHAACLVFASHPDGALLASFAVEAKDSAFAVTYVHSVTHTPVEERYRIDGTSIVETAILFAEHGPGLPTEADAGERWTRRNGRFEVTMNRRFERIVMRVDGAQTPTLRLGARTVDLAQWGNRAIVLEVKASACGSS